MLNEENLSRPNHPDDERVIQLVERFYHRHRNPKQVFDMNLLAVSEMNELSLKTELPVAGIKSLLYLIDEETVAKTGYFGKFQSLGHLKNDISPQALIDLGDTETATENGRVPKLLAECLDPIELSIFYAFQVLQDKAGIQFDQIILDNEQDINHVVIEVGQGNFTYHVENMTETFRVNFEQRLLKALANGRYWNQVYAA